MFTPENTSFDLNQKPDIVELFRLRQISGLQQDFVAKLRTLTNAPIEQEVLLPNIKYPNYPFRADIVIGEVGGLQILVEIDGKYYHDNPKSHSRDKRKNKTAEDMGYIVIRIVYEIPRRFIYGHLKGRAREQVKAQYEAWREDWINTETQKIIKKYEYQLKNNL